MRYLILGFYHSMQLIIDATTTGTLIVGLMERSQVSKKNQKVGMRVTSDLLQMIVKLVGSDLNKLKGIILVNKPGSFTSVRIAVVVANTLSQLLNIPLYQTSADPWILDQALKLKRIKRALPVYGGEPNITL